MKIQAELVQKISKNGKEYICIEIKLSDTYKKIVFLEPSEIELLKMYYNNK